MSKIKFNISNPFKEGWSWSKIDRKGKIFIIGIIVLFASLAISDIFF